MYKLQAELRKLGFQAGDGTGEIGSNEEMGGSGEMGGHDGENSNILDVGNWPLGECSGGEVECIQFGCCRCNSLFAL